MSFTKSVMTAIAVTTLSFAAHVQVGKDASIKPLQGIVFQSGDAKGVGYFLSGDGVCELVVTLAQNLSSEITRYEVAVASGQTYQVPVGHSRFRFSCIGTADSMSVKRLRQIAQAD